MKWLPPTTNEPGAYLCDWQQRVNYKSSYSSWEKWSCMRVGDFLKRIGLSVTGRATSNNLNFTANKLPFLIEGGYDLLNKRSSFSDLKILFYIFLFLWQLKIIKWVIFFCDHMSDSFSLPPFLFYFFNVWNCLHFFILSLSLTFYKTL